MPRIYYLETNNFKRKNSTNFKRFLSVFFVMILFLGLVLSASLVTNVLKVNGLNLGLNLSKSNKNTLKYYLLSLGSYDTFGEAESVSITATLLGASGYIWEQDNKYFVLGSVYATNENAKSVQNNFDNTEYKTEVLPVKISFTKVLNEKFSKEQKEKITDTIAFLKRVCDSLIENSIKLDKKEISYIIASNNLNNLKSDLVEYKNNFEYFFDDKIESIINFKTAILKIESLLDKTVNSLIQNDSVNYNIKNCLCGVVRYCYEIDK